MSGHVSMCQWDGGAAAAAAQEEEEELLPSGWSPPKGILPGVHQNLESALDWQPDSSWDSQRTRFGPGAGSRCLSPTSTSIHKPPSLIIYLLHYLTYCICARA
ncbi:UNVERIFIED_CONTAM: hypothetical protein K2H54_062574 [Gekko kuhli]